MEETKKIESSLIDELKKYVEDVTEKKSKPLAFHKDGFAFSSDEITLDDLYWIIGDFCASKVDHTNEGTASDGTAPDDSANINVTIDGEFHFIEIKDEKQGVVSVLVH